jgi:hypothetical protein
MDRVPSSKVSSQSALFVFGEANMRLITTEIGSKYGPFDIAMIPIWRGGTLSFFARLGFRVRFFSFLTPPYHSHPRKLT